MRINDEDTETFLVEYDRTFQDAEGQELLDELKQITGKEPRPTLKKAYEPIQMLIIAVGVFIVGSIAEGFFRKIGYDLYDKLKGALAKYYRAKGAAERILDLRFSTKQDQQAFEVHVLIVNPSEKDINGFFDNKLKDLEALLISLPLNEAKDIAQLVLEWKNESLSIRYAVNSTCVPFTFERRERREA